MNHNKFFITWLHNAHAMEKDLIQTLNAHSYQADNYPEIQDKINKHLEQTEKHADIVEKILIDLGENTSGMKDTIAMAIGSMKGASTGAAEDKMIKNAISEYASEQMEIASYSALIVAAEQLGHNEIVTKLKGILKDEEQMAKWLEKNLPNTVKTFLKDHQE